MPRRTIAIGDIHGCAVAFRALLEHIDPQPEDTLVLMGDYVDRGPDSCGVLDTILELREKTRLVPLLGNHDEMLLGALRSAQMRENWLQFGGRATLDSYGPEATTADIPETHVELLRCCQLYHETSTHLFFHANYDPDLSPAEQPALESRWLSLRDVIPGEHASGKIAVVAHTPQPDGDILDLGYLLCVDTGCCYGGFLTALWLERGVQWQVDQDGQLRRGNV